MTAKSRANLKLNPLTGTQFADGQAVPGEQFVHIADSMAYQAEMDSLTGTVNAIASATGLFTAINNGSGETGTVWTVDSTTGFLAGMTIVYPLNDGTIKTNIIASVDSATQITVSTSESGTLADNAIVAAVAPGLGGAALRWYDIRVYGASTSATDNSTAIQAAITAAGAVKGAVFIPAGTWAVQAKLTVDANIAIVGTGRGSIIKNTGSTDTIEFGTGAAAVECVVRDVTLWNASGSGHIVTCATKGMLNSVFDSVFFDQDEAGKRCINVNISGTGSAYQNVAHNDCVFDITKAHTVSAILLTSESSRFNGTKWTGGEWHAYGAQVTFCEIYTTSTSTYNYGQIFRGITIEQTIGGALHIKAGYGTLVEDCVIYDTFAVTTSTTGAASAISAAAPSDTGGATVTSTAHGLSNGDRITISGLSQMTQLNGSYARVVNQSTNAFEIAQSGSSSIVSSLWKWTLSGSGTNEYYLTTSGGGDPSFSSIPIAVRQITSGTWTYFARGTLGSLTANQWKWGNNDGLGFSTIYVRLASGADPDTLDINTLQRLTGYDTSAYTPETTGGTWTKLQDTTDHMWEFDEVTSGLASRNIHIRNCHRVDTQNPLGSGKYDIALTSAAQVFITNCAGNQAAGVNHNINNKQCVIQRGLSDELLLTNRNSSNSIVLDYQGVTAPTFTGALVGNVTGNVTGALTGDSTNGDVKRGQTAFGNDQAVSTNRSRTVLITKGSICALTLADPTSGTHDGVRITFVATTAYAHTVSNAAGSGFNSGGAGSDVATFGGAIGDSFTVEAYQGKWYTLHVRNVTFA